MKPDISTDSDELSRKVAEWLVQYIQNVLETKDRFTLALSGGSTPQKLYHLLSGPPYAEKINWKAIHFFWGDERYVPYEDDRNNAKMAFTTLLEKVPVEKNNIHRMRTDIGPDDAAAEYETILRTYFKRDEKSFDLVLLGLGDDAHTLSLFPGYDVMFEKEKWVRAFFLEKQQMFRITLTVPVINMASQIIFLVTGGDKAVPVSQVIYGMHQPDLYPAQMIQPYNGQVQWYLDKAAAKEIS